MPKTQSPILQKVSNLLKISIFIPNMVKPRISNLIFLKKTGTRIKRFRLLKHYNYGFVQEYEFSPSSTPLIHYYHINPPLKKRNYRNLYSIFLRCYCLGSLRGDGADGHCTLEGALPAAIEFEPFDWGEEEDSVDQRAERFIEKFYEEMRMQRQESALQLSEVLEIGC